MIIEARHWSPTIQHTSPVIRLVDPEKKKTTKDQRPTRTSSEETVKAVRSIISFPSFAIRVCASLDSLADFNCLKDNNALCLDSSPIIYSPGVRI